MNSLSGRVLTLTVIFVMIAEVLIFVPSIARFRQEYLTERLERAQLASLALLADPMIDGALEAELLRRAGVLNVVVLRGDRRQLVLAVPINQPLSQRFDLRDPSAWTLIMDAFARLFETDNQVIVLTGSLTDGTGDLIEIAMETDGLRSAMIDYGLRILLVSLVISALAAGLLFFAVRFVLVQPIRQLVGSMHTYREAPEDHRRVIQPRSRIKELREAEESLRALETELSKSLRRKERLASLGEAVAKISHDLRNILSSTQLFADRLEEVDDPLAVRLVPKLLGSVRRAVSLTESTLAFGSAEEPTPRPERFNLAELVEDVCESEALALDQGKVTLHCEVPKTITILADEEQIFRVISNLVRNAAQAIQNGRKSGTVTVSAEEDATGWIIRVRDTGPGLPKQAAENLFVAFRGTARKGGTGLGLVIAAELVRGHGGTLKLVETSAEGTCFAFDIPAKIGAHV